MRGCETGPKRLVFAEHLGVGGLASGLPLFDEGAEYEAKDDHDGQEQEQKHVVVGEAIAVGLSILKRLFDPLDLLVELPSV